MKFGLIAASAMLALWSSASQAAVVPQVSGAVGTHKFDFHKPETMEESLAALENPFSNAPTEFGVTVDYRIGFSQLVNLPDRTSMVLKLALPKEMVANLKPGTYELGNTPVEHDEQGWSSQCPDLEQDKALFSVTYYGKPGPDSMPAMLNVPAGDFVSYAQTQHTRIRHDNAVLVVQAIDPAARIIEGEVSGEISSVVAKDPPEVNQKKPTGWMCNPAEFKVTTERFKVKFRLPLTRSWRG
jgi:hypothetical protein